ncbi:hypothetical protein [Cohnella sp. JJ-181]|uniref:hypothetical protein n=1 Tax=Cohnella rhizoplanae TaxID=2974897 RepID=UPI0022FFA423|nr:hypothetical protein [Cohnella sp. JJ-181]CAI6037512.1 hypothetical protein COHCIP112018_00951 [Cohnella sp. JJ-181]
MPLLHHAGALLSLALVFWTGSSLFAVLHPRIVLALAQGGQDQGEAGEATPARQGRIRLQGGMMSLAGLILLALPMLT